jgi:hypothetical protein
VGAKRAVELGRVRRETQVGGSYSAVSRMGVANRRRNEWRVWSRDDVVEIKRDDEEEEGNKR